MKLYVTARVVDGLPDNFKEAVVSFDSKFKFCAFSWNTTPKTRIEFTIRGIIDVKILEEETFADELNSYLQLDINYAGSVKSIVSFGKQDTINKLHAILTSRKNQKTAKRSAIQAYSLTLKTMREHKFIESILQSTPLRSTILKEFDASYISDIANLMKISVIEKGENIMAHGGMLDQFIVVQEGKLGIFASNTSMERELTAGEYFGESAFVFARKCLHDVTAVEDSIIWTLQGDEFKQIRETGRKNMENMKKKFIARLQDKLSATYTARWQDFEQRLLDFVSLEEFPPGEVLAKKNYPFTSMIYLIYGEVDGKLTRKKLEKPQKLGQDRILGQFESNPKNEKFKVGKSPYTWHTVEKSLCLVIDAHRLTEILNDLSDAPVPEPTATTGLLNNSFMSFTTSGGSFLSGGDMQSLAQSVKRKVFFAKNKTLRRT